MVAPVRSNRVAFRRAVLASVAVHVALAVVLVVVLRSRPDAKSPQPGIDTRADVVVRMFADEPSVATQTPQIAPSPAVEPSESMGGLRPPLASPIAQSLPPELLAVIRNSARAASSPISDPNVKHVAGASPVGSVAAIHGALKPGQVVVYVLDCSGSMGEFGKLALARAALVATLRGQPEGVRFQVISYNSTARAVLPGTMTLPATSANVSAAEAKSLALEANGRSDHAEAVRVATRYRPDVILLLTDAKELSLAQFKPALASAGKPILLSVATVTAAGVGTPQELR
jgi:hypothetical protein